MSEEVNLVAPVYVTHLETDKPMYQPGEVVHYRSLTLDRFSLKPVDENLRLSYELVTPTRGMQTLAQNVNGLQSAKAEAPSPYPSPPPRGRGVGVRGRSRGRTANRFTASAPANSSSTPTWTAASTPWSAARRTTASPSSVACSSSITIRNSN